MADHVPRVEDGCFSTPLVEDGRSGLRRPRLTGRLGAAVVVAAPTVLTGTPGGPVRTPAGAHRAAADAAGDWFAWRSASPGALAGRVAAGLLAVVLLAAASVQVSEAVGLSVPLAVAAGSGGVCVLALALLRYDVAVALGLLLMAVVEVEPAPPDVIFAIIIAVALLTGRFFPRRAPVVVAGAIGALVLLNIVSTVAVIGPVAALRFSAITVFLAVLALWLACWVDSPRRSRMVVVTWLVGAVLSSLVGIVVVFFPFSFPGREILMDVSLARPDVLFQDANVYGPFLIPIAVIVLEEIVRPRLLPRRPVFLALLFLILGLGVLVSFSRAGWANFVVAVLVMLGVAALRRRGGRAVLSVLVALAIAAVAAATVIARTGQLSFLEERAQLQSYDTERFDAQRAGVEMGLQYPLGVGPGQFEFHHSVEAHSTFVRVLAEQGVLGLAAWVALAAGTLFLAVRNVVRGWDTYGIGSASLLGAWCGLLVNGVVVDTLHWRHMWVVAALIWAADIRGRTGDAAARARHGEAAAPRRATSPGRASAQADARHLMRGRAPSPSGPGLLSTP
jgi:O-antigen ligase